MLCRSYKQKTQTLNERVDFLFIMWYYWLYCITLANNLSHQTPQHQLPASGSSLQTSTTRDITRYRTAGRERRDKTQSSASDEGLVIDEVEVGGLSSLFQGGQLLDGRRQRLHVTLVTTPYTPYTYIHTLM